MDPMFKKFMLVQLQTLINVQSITPLNLLICWPLREYQSRRERKWQKQKRNFVGIRQRFGSQNADLPWTIPLKIKEQVLFVFFTHLEHLCSLSVQHVEILQLYPINPFEISPRSDEGPIQLPTTKFANDTARIPIRSNCAYNHVIKNSFLSIKVF